MPDPAPWTVRRLTEWTVGYLKKGGVAAPQKEARILLGHVMGIPPIEVIARSDDEPDDGEKARFKELIKRRADGVPVAYLTGKRDFYTLGFEVTPDVLIPRPDTETLVLAAIDRIGKKAGARVLELGTGSGCVAVSLAHEVRSATVTAIDISPAALAVAARNAARHGVESRVTFLEGDWLAAIPLGETFDLVVSNPPYIAEDELPALDREVRDHEPRLALVGGADGLDYYRRTAEGALAVLAEGGGLLLEVGHTQAAAVGAILAAAGWRVGATLKDLARIDRVVTATKPG